MNEPANMETFNKLSLVAQYDDMCRVMNKLIKESSEEENACINMLESLQKRWDARQRSHEREKEALKSQITSLEKEIKKLNRQLVESRSALVRESDEKKAVAREKQALLDQIRQVRQLVEKESYGDTDAHRKRVIKCLDIERLSPIASDDSDDCVSGLDYDRTEEDIINTTRSPHQTRRSAAFENVLEGLQPNEQPTLLYRFLDKDKNSDEHLNDNHQRDRNEPRRSNRLTSKRRSEKDGSPNAPTSATSSNQTEPKTADLNLDTDSMQTDDNDIEKVRQQLQMYETEKQNKLAASTNSTPNIKEQKRGATLSSKPTASMLKSLSCVSTPVPNAIKPHTFTEKKSFKPESCVPCGKKVGFYGSVVKCEVCGVISHKDCADQCPLPCVKITAPNPRRLKKVLISDYVNSDAVPKVPALIVHCCNEIERGDNIKKPGLYRANAHQKDIEDLMSKILKSKSGMPNLSNIEVDILCGVVKTFLQHLDESLITTTLWNHFAEALKLDSLMEAKTHMSYYISLDLPTANRDTIAFLMQHLHTVARHSNENMMTTKNLARCLAPTIVGNSCRQPHQSQIQNETKTQVKIMEILFEIDADFWANYVPRIAPDQSHQTPTSYGSRLLKSAESHTNRNTRSSRLGGSTLPTPKLKPLFS